MHNLPGESKGFRPLKGPQITGVQQKFSERVNQAKSLCRMTQCTDEELFCNFIPMMAKLNGNSLALGINFIVPRFLAINLIFFLFQLIKLCEILDCCSPLRVHWWLKTNTMCQS